MNDLLHRRTDDAHAPARPRRDALTALLRLGNRRAAGLDTVLGGQLLLLGAGATVAVAAPLLAPNSAGWVALAAVSATMVAGLALSMVLPWRRLPTQATLAFPFLVCAGLVVLALNAPGIAAPLTGVLVLCAAYVGLTHREGTIVIQLPVSAATFVVVNDGWTRITSVRLVIASVIWILLAELLARLSTRHRTLSQALRSAAQTDVLTGVGNRREIDLRLALTAPGDVVVLCDLDHFKALNDSRGHLAGDRVLAQFGAMLRAELREDDSAGRFGGEEFLLVLPQSSLDAAGTLLARVRESWALMQPDVTFSSGLAQCRGDRTVEDTVAVADVALYQAKDQGRNCGRTELDIDVALIDALL